jgi:hypothetical protein
MIVRAIVHNTTWVNTKKDGAWVCPGNGASPGQWPAHTCWSYDWNTRHLASSSVHISKLLQASKSFKASYWWAIWGKLPKVYNIDAREPSIVSHALGSIKGHDHSPSKAIDFRPIQTQASSSLSSPKLIQALLKQLQHTPTSFLKLCSCNTLYYRNLNYLS